MNVGSLNNQLSLNHSYLTLGTTVAASTNNNSFTEMLERAAEAEDKNIPVLSSGRAVIDRNSKLFEMCQEFETFLLKTLVNSMRDTVQKSELLDTGLAGKIYEDMLYDEYTKDFARNAGLGFAELAYLDLTGQRGKTICLERP